MDIEKESKNLTEKLLSLENAVRGELAKIESVKAEISKGYRRHNKEKYQAMRGDIAENIKKYEAEMLMIKKKLSELQAK